MKYSVQTRNQPLIDINLKQVLSSGNLQQAWRRVRKNKGAPGIDGMNIEAFPDFIKKAWKEFILLSLQDGSYQPTPVRRVIIEKEDGGERMLVF